MVFYYTKHSLYVPPLPLPSQTHIRQSSVDSEGSTISANKETTKLLLLPNSSIPRRRSVQFRQTVQMYEDVHERVEPADRWYSADEIRTFLNDSKRETTTTLASNKMPRRRQRVQQAYALYSQGLDIAPNDSEEYQKACQAIGLDLLVVHAHLRRRNNERRCKLMKRIDELQDIECPVRRERLLAQASLGISESAVFAAAHLAQWWSSNNTTILQ